MSHIAPISFKVSATLAAYRIVTVNTALAYGVAYPSAATIRPIGVTTDTVLDTTGSIPVATSGIVKVYFNDSITTGSLVAADSSGRGVLHASVSAGSYAVGILVGPSVNTTGTIADVLLGVSFEMLG